ncbi:MAG TPA: glycosyltransferase, partial [Vicinamibacteria bacterium]
MPSDQPGLPLVTVVLPTHNRAHLIARAIDSVLAQTYEPIECIVVDDGSTDGTPEVLARYGDRIRVIRQ